MSGDNIRLKLGRNRKLVHTKDVGVMVKDGTYVGGIEWGPPGREYLKRPSCMVKWWWFLVRTHSATLLDD